MGDADQSFAAQNHQCGLEGLAADLQVFAEVAFARQEIPPLTLRKGFAEAIRDAGDQRETFWDEGHA